MEMRELFESTVGFADRLIVQLQTLHMLGVCRDLEMDHICVRLNTVDAIQRLHRELLEVGVNISTAMVNGRNIHIVRLHEPLQVGHWHTRCIEVPLPKVGTLYPSGWEHVEFVLPTPVNNLAALQLKFSDQFGHLDNLTFRDKYRRQDDMPHANRDQRCNPTIAIKREGVVIKFHPLSIEDVVGAAKP